MKFQKNLLKKENELFTILVDKERSNMLEISVDGEPVFGEKMIVSISMLEGKVRLLDDIAKDIEISRTQLINLCIDSALKNEEFLHMLGYDLDDNEEIEE